MQVAIIDQNRKPLAPTSAVRARLLLKEGKAAVFRRAPFTLSDNQSGIWTGRLLPLLQKTLMEQRQVINFIPG
jgi:RRXRR protein